jgi:hypothetical protein
VQKASKTRSRFSGSMPGRESRTATITPFVGFRSVLINSSRSPHTVRFAAELGYQVTVG